jgi:opacity protein-like surface antigen
MSVGPLLQLGVSDDKLYFAPTLQLYVHPRLDGVLEPLRPYGHAGIGLAYLDKDDRRNGRDDDDVDFQFTAGLGFDYELREDLFLGTGLLFNVVPGSVVGERFIFSWQVMTFRHAF